MGRLLFMFKEDRVGHSSAGFDHHCRVRRNSRNCNVVEQPKNVKDNYSSRGHRRGVRGFEYNRQDTQR